MNNVLSNFQQTLQRANGDEVKMKKAFQGISDFLNSTLTEKQDAQSLDEYLSENPPIKKIHEWSETVLVNDHYELVNY